MWSFLFSTYAVIYVKHLRSQSLRKHLFWAVMQNVHSGPAHGQLCGVSQRLRFPLRSKEFVVRRQDFTFMAVIDRLGLCNALASCTSLLRNQVIVMACTFVAVTYRTGLSSDLELHELARRSASASSFAFKFLMMASWRSHTGRGSLMVARTLTK